MHAFLRTSQIFTLVSTLPVTTKSPKGWWCIEVTAARWPGSDRANRPSDKS
jgi:hypothetical protein